MAAAVAAGPSYHVIYNFTGQHDQPGFLGEMSPGVFYTIVAPEAVVSVTVQGALATLASFPTGSVVGSFPASGGNGLLYSSIGEATISSGYVFSMSIGGGGVHNYPAWGAFPSFSGNLPDGKLFGLVYDFTVGPWYLGTSDLQGNVTTFYQFPTYDRPNVPILGADGNYYGVDASYAANYNGILYKVTPSGAFTQVAALPFIPTAYAGEGVVLQATDGNFYGIQSIGLGCGGQKGGIYKITPAGQYSLLYNAGCHIVNDLIQASDGNLYGVTQGGVIFSLTTSGAYKNVFVMNGYDGLCPCTLMQGHDGVLYGATSGGGTTGGGVIFALDLGLPAPQPQALRFYPPSGPVGTAVRIWGYNLLESTVAFNGVPATTVRHSGPNYVWANVPTGATTGPITVTTAGGTSTTKASFAVE